MALFGDKNRKHKRRFLESPGIDLQDPATSVLGKTFNLEGDLRTSGDTIMAGYVEGVLEVAGRLVLLRGGRVKGSVLASGALVEGTVEGPVSVSEKLEVGPSARVTGDLSAGTLAIAEGALVQGALNSNTEPMRFTEKREAEDV